MLSTPTIGLPTAQFAGVHGDSRYAASNLRASIQRSKLDEGKFRGMRERFASVVGNQVNRENARLGKLAALGVQRGQPSTPTSFAGAIEDATRRAKARSGIMLRGQQAVDAQNLRDRIGFVKAGQYRRGVEQRGLQAAVNIREGVNVGIQDANQRVAASRAAFQGGTLGGVTGFLANEENRDWLKNLFSRKAPATAPSALSQVPT